MKVTKKELITRVSVEIGFQEFWDALVQAIKDVKADKTIKHLISTTARDLMLAYDKPDEITLKEAKSCFKNSYVDDVHNAVITAIAEKNGMSVENFGYLNKHTEELVCVFKQNGAHI